jgi:aldehyde dehydrogenase (NAD+)
MDEVLERVIDRARTIRLGDPAQVDTEMGPVANRAQFDKINGMIRAAVAEGATLACGGADASPGGLFIPPTILTGVTPDMGIAREEVFGPVLCVIPFDDEEEAIRIANDTEFGLAAGVWTLNVQRAHRMARSHPRVGQCRSTYRDRGLPRTPSASSSESGGAGEEVRNCCSGEANHLRQH